MAKVESGKVYVRIGPSQAKESKRDILRSMANIINMLIISKKFKKIENEGLAVVSQGKRDTQEILEDIEKLQEKLPQMEKPIEKERIGKRKGGRVRREFPVRAARHVSKMQKYRMELEDIKDRLAKLSEAE